MGTYVVSVRDGNLLFPRTIIGGALVVAGSPSAAIAIMQRKYLAEIERGERDTTNAETFHARLSKTQIDANPPKRRLRKRRWRDDP